MILKMAWKNMFRYKKRSLVTASAVAFGVIFTVLFDSLIYGISNETDINLLNYECSSVKFFNKEYFPKIDERSLDYLIEKYDRKKIENYLEEKKIPYSAELSQECEIYFNEDYFETSGSITGILQGVDVQKIDSVYKLSDSLQSGSWLKKDEGEDFCSGAVVGSWIADDMGAQVGWYITVQCKGKGGFTQTMDVPIVGILHCPNSTINSNYIFMDLNYLDYMLEMEESVTAINVNCGNYFNIDSSVAKFEKDLNASKLLKDTDVETKNWRQINADCLQMQSFYEVVTNLLMIFLFIIAAVGISNTMLMSVMERKNEIAMLKAMGYSGAYIKKLFACEGACLGFAGCVIGFVIACLINIPLTTKGINIGGLLDGVDMGFRINNIVRSEWDPAGFVRVTLGALLISAFAAFIPACSISKKEISDIFRNQ